MQKYDAEFWKSEKTNLGTVMLYEGMGGLKKDGKFYLYCGLLKESGKDPMVEVTEEVYTDYMRDIWRREKARERAVRCSLGTRRCMDDCSKCVQSRIASEVSLEYLQETLYFDPADDSWPVEKVVIAKIMLEQMIRLVNEQFAGFSWEEMYFVILRYFVTYTQKEIASEFGISQPAVLKREEKLLRKMRTPPPELNKFKNWL